MVSNSKNLNLSARLFVLFCFFISLNNVSSEEIKILTYNTHGLPAIFSGDEPSNRFPLIAKETNRYHISLLQEDFAHHEILLKNIELEHDPWFCTTGLARQLMLNASLTDMIGTQVW